MIHPLLAPATDAEIDAASDALKRNLRKEYRHADRPISKLVLAYVLHAPKGARFVTWIYERYKLKLSDTHP